MPREDSPYYEPEADCPRQATLNASDEDCDCCRAHGLLAKGYQVNGLGFVLCQRCTQGRCQNCGGE